MAGVIAAFAIRKCIFFVTLVSSNSMYPSIKQGDRLLTKRIRGGIERGDILIFFSKELGLVLVKRVIGLPGELVEIGRDGEVFINNEKLQETYVEINSGPAGTFIVPEKNYFFMGDNRSYSRDSRTWAEPYIPDEDILGKALICIYPFRKINC
ncbi:MAG: lepB [Firmicutes bacterium]|nr:lepB [Bacillota bacterium]